MCERARRSRDSSSRYSIDTLFPGLSNNSTHGRNSHSGPVVSTLAPGVHGTTTISELSSKPVTGTISHNHNQKQFGGGGSRSRSHHKAKTTATSNAVAVATSIISGILHNDKQVAGIGISEISSLNSGVKRRAGSPLKPATQPKQMSLLSTTKMSKKTMLEVFQPWVLNTYGDSAKTKTITKKKYHRIIKTLRGEEINNAENSKFRFWVKAKGFHVGAPPGYPKDEIRLNSLEPDLFVPTTVKDGTGGEKPVYKRVAVVEHFFDIIYTVHVETEAKNGKHAGQKRTYRAITEKYAFLPREAVTKFLLQCMECQKRGSPGGDSAGNGKHLLGVDSSTPSPENSLLFGPGTTTGKNFSSSTTSTGGAVTAAAAAAATTTTTTTGFDINFSLPFTTTYLRQQQMRLRNGFQDHDDDDEEEEESRMSDVGSMDENHDHGSSGRSTKSNSNNSGSGGSNSIVGDGKLLLLSSESTCSEIPAPVDWLGYHPIGLKKELTTQTTCSNNNSIYSNGKQDFREQSSPLSLSDRSGVNHETGQDETSSNGNKDDEEDDDDESEDKIDTQQHDPERLKAFNMFVRLFVDENLDRMVPISKQPKEKIQAIIDSCTRQFPEFAERARKRIRTYLKSCRRNKRSRDSTGWESSRPTPAHLTSVQAEQILAQACENESQNAKRMRMGLEPVGQPLPLPTNGNRSSMEGLGHRDIDRDHGNTSSSSSNSSPEKVSKSTPTPSTTSTSVSASAISTAAAIAAVVSLSSQSSSLLTAATAAVVSGLSDSNLSSQNLCSRGRSPILENSSALPKSILSEKSHLLDYSRALNGNGVSSMSMYRPNFCQAFTRPAPFPGIFAPATTTSSSGIGIGSGTFPLAHSASPIPASTNGDIGPTDLSMKSKPLMTHKLNGTEMATVRQLITGYRESAAFLLRSADELEQLLIQQQ